MGTLRMHVPELVVNSLDEEDDAFDFAIRQTEVLEDQSTGTPTQFVVQLTATERFDDEHAVW